MNRVLLIFENYMATAQKYIIVSGQKNTKLAPYFKLSTAFHIREARILYYERNKKRLMFKGL